MGRAAVVASLAAALFLVALAAACAGDGPEGPVVLGGESIPADVLEDGRRVYVRSCRPCHGERGDGLGPAAVGLVPAPRDFTKGVFKFASVPKDELPTDADLERTVREGLHGTAMQAWGLSAEEVSAVVDYLKTFSPRWQTGKPGTPIEITPDPYGAARAAEAVARGRVVYHGMARCGTCHPSYATRREIYEMTATPTRPGVSKLRPEPYLPRVDESPVFGRVLPPDFTFRPLRSVRSGHELEDLYRVIAAGVGGTAMIKWKGALPEADLWALAYYVRSLARLRDTPAALDLRDALANQPPFEPPPPATPPPDAAPGDTP